MRAFFATIVLPVSLGLGCAPRPSTTPSASSTPTAGATSLALANPKAAVTLPDALTIETKTKVRSFPPRQLPGAPPRLGGFSFDPKEECKEELVWPEVKGAASPEIDATINRAVANDAWILQHKEDFAALSMCQSGERMQVSRSFEVMHNASFVFAVRVGHGRARARARAREAERLSRSGTTCEARR